MLDITICFAAFANIDCFDCLLRPKHNFPGHSSINGEQRSLCAGQLWTVICQYLGVFNPRPGSDQWEVELETNLREDFTL